MEGYMFIYHQTYGDIIGIERDLPSTIETSVLTGISSSFFVIIGV
jgi:hypothetical protein